MLCARCSACDVWRMMKMLCIRFWGVGWPMNDGIGKCCLQLCYKGLIGLHSWQILSLISVVRRQLMFSVRLLSFNSTFGLCVMTWFEMNNGRQLQVIVVKCWKAGSNGTRWKNTRSCKPVDYSSQQRIEQWVKSNVGWVKVNIDIAFRRASHSTVLRCCVRDSNEIFFLD